MKNNEKTNVMRVLDGKKIAYESHSYEPDQSLTGEEIAGILGEDPKRVFKTLVTRGKTGQYYVFVVPVQSELDLKKAAKAAGEKSVEMIKQKELLPLTGYVRGGCSPIGMKKRFPTFVDEIVLMHSEIAVSAGQRGVQVCLKPEDLLKAADAKVHDLIRY